NVPYVRNLALLVLLSTFGAGLLDYVFKVKAAGLYTQGPDLVRFFALFYTGTGVATLLIQSLFSRIAVERFGVARTVGSLPLSLAVCSVGSLLFSAISMAFASRGGEAVIRTSLFKSGYEMLYAA